MYALFLHLCYVTACDMSPFPGSKNGLGPDGGKAIGGSITSLTTLTYLDIGCAAPLPGAPAFPLNSLLPLTHLSILNCPWSQVFVCVDMGL